MRNRQIAAVAGLALFSFCLKAQSIFVIPASSGASSTVTGFSLPALTPIGLNAGAFTATAATFQVIYSADGTKLYVVSNSGANTVLTESPLLSNAQTIASFLSGATASALIPNGRQLVVASGNTLQIISTQNDTFAIPGGISLGSITSSVVDLAIGLDSTRAFVLVNQGNNTFVLETVNLQSLTVINTTAIGGQATGVSIGPNALVYVSTTNQLLEIDPNSLAVRNTISLNGIPGKLSFTPDGKLGLAINETPVTGAAMMIFDLNAKTLSSTLPTSSLPANVTSNPGSSKLFPIGNTRVLLFSAGAQTLYDVTLNPSPNPATVVAFAATAQGGVGTVATSGDFAAGSNAVTNYLFYVSGNSLFEFNLRANLGAGQTTFTGSGGGLSVTSPANTAGTPATIQTFGDQQNVALTSTTAPLVVRVLDAQGNPVAGATVTFSTATAGATLTATSAVTSRDGFALTSAVAPSNAGSMTVQVAVTGTQLASSFTANVGSSGGGGPASNGGLSVVLGQGSLIRESTSTAGANATMTAKLSDSGGNGVSGATIVFNVTTGTGTLQCANGGLFCSANGTSLSVTTDNNGLVQADYLAPPVNSFPGLEPATITATTTGGNSVTFFVTAFSAVRQPTIIQAPQSVLQLGVTFSGSGGQTVTGALQVQVVDGTGKGIPNVSLRVLNPPDPTIGPSANCANVFAMSDANGLASCDLVLGGKVGTFQMNAEAGYFVDFGPFNLSVGPGAPAKANIVQGNNQSGKPGDILPLALLVQITDAFGNASPNAPVTWKVLTAGALTLTAPTSTATDFNGRASTRITIGNFSGTAQVQVTSGSASATFTVTVSVPVSGIQIVSGNSQNATVGTQFGNLLVVRVTTAQGGVPNFPVTFAITSGVGTLSNPSATTDANGNASTNVSAGNTAGSLVITATSAGFSVTFTLTISPPGPTNVIFLNGASLQGVNPPVSNVVAAGEIVTMQGNGLAPGVVGVVTATNIIGAQPLTLAGITIKFNNIPAPIFSVSNVNGVQQVTVQVPFELAGSSSATVSITTPGGGSGSFTVSVQGFAPGVFETSAFGLAHQVLAIRPDGSYVSPANPAHLGEIIIIFVTGFGQTSPPSGTNDSGIPGQSIAAPIVVGLNGGGVGVVSAQSVLGMVGVYAIAIQVPSDLVPGDQVPVGVIVYDAAGNANFAQGTVMPIAP